MRRDIHNRAEEFFAVGLLAGIAVIAACVLFPELVGAAAEGVQQGVETAAGILAGIITSMIGGLAAAAGALGSVETVATVSTLAAIAGLTVVSADSGQDDQKPTYEPSPKHGPVQRGNVGAEPTHGQETLDRSVPIKPTTSRRVGYDVETGEFDVFDETSPGVYHGHQRTWDELTQDMQNALVQSGAVNRRGKPQ